MDKVKTIIQMVREFLPAPGTRLGEFTFLSPDALWGGTLDKKPDGLSFAVVAEDRWPDGGMFLMVLENGRVYVGDLDGYCLVVYCAASFPQFMMIWNHTRKPLKRHLTKRNLIGRNLRNIVKMQNKFCGKWLWTLTLPRLRIWMGFGAP